MLGIVCSQAKTPWSDQTQPAMSIALMPLSHSLCLVQVLSSQLQPLPLEITIPTQALTTKSTPKEKEHPTSFNSVWLLVPADGVQFKFHGLLLLEKILPSVMFSTQLLNGLKGQLTATLWLSKFLSICHQLTTKLQPSFLVSLHQQNSSKFQSTKKIMTKIQENSQLSFILTLSLNQLPSQFPTSFTLKFTLSLIYHTKWDHSVILELIKFQVPLALAVSFNITSLESEIDFWLVLVMNAQTPVS